MRSVRIGPVDQELRIPQASAITLTAVLSLDGVPVDLTTKTVYFTVKASRNSAASVILGLSNTTGEHSDPTAGETQFTISTTDFTSYSGPTDVRLAYEVRVTDTPYLQGPLILEPVVGRT